MLLMFIPPIKNRAGAALTTSYSRGEVQVNTGFTEFNSVNQSAFPGEFTGRSLVADAYNKYTLGKSLYSLVGISYISDRAEFGEPREFRLLDPYLNMVYVSGFWAEPECRRASEYPFGIRGPMGLQHQPLLYF